MRSVMLFNTPSEVGRTYHRGRATREGRNAGEFGTKHQPCVVWDSNNRDAAGRHNMQEHERTPEQGQLGNSAGKWWCGNCLLTTPLTSWGNRSIKWSNRFRSMASERASDAAFRRARKWYLCVLVVLGRVDIEGHTPENAGKETIERKLAIIQHACSKLTH